MRRYFSHQFPNEIKTYVSLLLAGIASVIVITFFLEVSDYAQHSFKNLIGANPYLSFIITPIVFVGIVYVAKYYCHYVQGSGIPQLIAATDSRNKSIREQLLSFRIALGKIGFIFLGMLGGAPIGIEGPSIHIGGSIFYGFNRFIKLNRKFLIHALIAIGGSAGLIVAFNAPIAGFLFAYEEIGRKLKKQALILIAIMSGIVYLFAIMYRGDANYLTNLSAYSLELTLVWQLLPLAILAGVLGGLFSKSTLFLINKFITHSKLKVITIAVVLGFIVASFNYLSTGQIAGSGKEEVLLMLGGAGLGLDFVAMKYFATLTSLASTIPGGLFMPSISIGAGIGSEVASFYTQIDAQVIIIMAMIAYLSAVIRAPLTSVFVILEMTTTLHLLIPGLMIAFIANWISKQIFAQPIYEALADNYLKLTGK
ncbi:MAG TPA: chloride channel protein [Gammaproteobacteria bacterium]|jgi:H+/Cl- antiporter ClcA|uniref:Chloride channel protein n=1 Tax=hydrothermal vent metagenome TaxID=652676 RepID=A0A1W1DIX8_9ZZZZ|nr:chloride channel protein [Gammaproteobacteria bacterium]HAE73313.1 chloride channel protein [Gammaproteobacteria bacterium]HCH58270.1 chloride channel protein [Gammaproteobacteria bacterium]HCV92595.1 chloride channel protein [Gammaproteobacteria bacterium]